MSISSRESSTDNSIMKIKLVILGKSLVGKSALTYRFICDKFPTEHDTTVEDQYKLNMTVEDIKCELEILDTAGQDDYQTMLDTWIEFGNCYLLVYSIDDIESFKQLKIKYDRICQIKNKEILNSNVKKMTDILGEFQVCAGEINSALDIVTDDTSNDGKCKLKRIPYEG